MTESFDKLEYWKARIHDQLASLFDLTVPKLREIVDSQEHIGVKKEDVQKALKLIGDGFDMLRKLSDGVIALKREEPKIIVPKGTKIS